MSNNYAISNLDDKGERCFEPLSVFDLQNLIQDLLLSCNYLKRDTYIIYLVRGNREVCLIDIYIFI